MVSLATPYPVHVAHKRSADSSNVAWSFQRNTGTNTNTRHALTMLMNSFFNARAFPFISSWVSFFRPIFFTATQTEFVQDLVTRNNGMKLEDGFVSSETSELSLDSSESDSPLDVSENMTEELIPEFDTQMEAANEPHEHSKVAETDEQNFGDMNEPNEGFSEMSGEESSENIGDRIDKVEQEMFESWMETGFDEVDLNQEADLAEGDTTPIEHDSLADMLPEIGTVMEDRFVNRETSSNDHSFTDDFTERLLPDVPGQETAFEASFDDIRSVFRPEFDSNFMGSPDIPEQFSESNIDDIGIISSDDVI